MWTYPFGTPFILLKIRKEGNFTSHDNIATVIVCRKVIFQDKTTQYFTFQDGFCVRSGDYSCKFSLLRLNNHSLASYISNKLLISEEWLHCSTSQHSCNFSSDSSCEQLCGEKHSEVIWIILSWRIAETQQKRQTISPEALRPPESALVVSHNDATQHSSLASHICWVQSPYFNVHDGRLFLYWQDRKFCQDHGYVSKVA